RFIRNFARIAGPLNDLLGGEGSKLKTESVHLGPEEMAAFHDLKRAALTSPVLAFADFKKDFLLETDASKKGLGAKLSQKQKDGKWHPVAFASRTLRDNEKNYHSSKLEFLALKWAVTEKFREYLAYRPFVVRTDNNPLTYVLKTPKLDATGLRWVGELAKYNFRMEYLKGTDNTVADVLSRMPQPCLSPEEVQEVLEDIPVEPPVGGGAPLDNDQKDSGDDWDEEKTVKVDEETVRAMLDAGQFGSPVRADVHRRELLIEGDRLDMSMEVLARQPRYLDRIHVLDWADEQFKDEYLQPIIRWLRSQKGFDLRLRMGDLLKDQTGQRMFNKRKEFYLENRVLFKRVGKEGEPDTQRVFVVPQGHRQAVLNAIHRDAGHQGTVRTQSLARERFWWPNMLTEIEDAVRKCDTCRAYNTKTAIAPLRPLTAYGPNELVHADFTNIEFTVDQGKRIVSTVPVLVIQDHFTKYPRVLMEIGPS
ncbi:MAG: hypothetical protein MJA29_11025, partial [Candidatus Omnitrophica bacterium]|nr:hypothetical protein [Candidatus Omnitrophota bacterium]